MPAGFASRGIYLRAFCFNGYNFDVIYPILKELPIKRWQGSCIGAFLALLIGGSLLFFLIPLAEQ